MFKFLRKYNKWILAVGGTLLLIVFLIPQAIQGLSQRAAVSSASWAVMDGEEISQREASQARDEAEVIDRLQRSGVPVIRGIDFIDTPEHWYLLVREADEVGLVGSNATVGISPDQLAPGLNPALILRTQANANGVSRMVGLYGSAAPLSDRRLRQEAQRLFHTAGAQIVVIEANPDAIVDDPTEAEIQAQMEAFADVAPGEGERGFGYRLPNRFKVEWLTIGADDVRSMLENSDEMSGVALRRHWRRQEAASGFPPVEDGAPVPDVVRDDLLERLTADKLDEIAKFTAQQLQNRRRGLPESEGYAVLPDDWTARRLALTELAELLQQKYEIPLPGYEAVGDRWLSVADLADLGDVAVATTDKFGSPVGLAQLITAAREFEGSVTVVMQSGVAGPPMRLADGSIVMIRMTDVDPARPPESIDEVRDAVVADLRRARHFDQLIEQQESIEARARDEGLLAVALDYDTVLQPRTNVSLANASDVVTYGRAGLVPPRRSSLLPQPIGPDEDAIAVIIDRALALDPNTDLADVPETERTFVVPVDDKLALMIVRLVDQFPLTNEQFASLVAAGGLQSMLLADELDQGAVIRDAFSFDVLAERHRFELDRGEVDEESETTDDATTEPDEIASAE